MNEILKEKHILLKYILKTYQNQLLLPENINHSDLQNFYDSIDVKSLLKNLQNKETVDLNYLLRKKLPPVPPKKGVHLHQKEIPPIPQKSQINQPPKDLKKILSQKIEITLKIQQDFIILLNRELEFSNIPPELEKYQWKIDIIDLQIMAYESLLLATSYLLNCSKENINTILTTIREALQITQEDHCKIMNFLLVFLFSYKVG